MSNSTAVTWDRAGHLVRVISPAGVEMSGFHTPGGSDAPVLLCLHGLSGHLDTSFVFEFFKTRSPLSAFHVLSIASSGQGNISMARQGQLLEYRLGGSAYERFEESVGDLAAWVDYAAQCTSGPIILLGHSLGASKVTHYLAQRRDARVKGLVLASAPDLKGAFIALHGLQRFEEFMAEARSKVAQDQGRSLMGEDCVIGLLRQRVSAQTLLDRFEDTSTADTFDFFGRESTKAFLALEQVTVPILAVYGQHGEIVGESGTASALALLKKRAVRAPSFDSLILAGNHWYMGAEAAFANALASWATAHCVDAASAEVRA
ncbi:alpha/beta hydrolase [Ottowia thiooxydans]|uniref:alpha/beta hydrolase n=1 Tax=Ottowia thiooxydans TaxID=219182 RepID=UPI00040F00AB|nr:alpha/beta fold hydrolase [Ottowia thiooxydans]